MDAPLLVVDAFAQRAFSGNPAAVCLLPGPAPEEWMQAVAAEMNLSETAFLHRDGDGHSLRWFTPRREVDLCGHATLASAHVLWSTGVLAAESPARFATRSGVLTCRRVPEGIAMDFPANPPRPAAPPPGLWEALGIAPCPVLRNRSDYLLVATDEASVRGARPDFRALAALDDVHGFVLTSPSADPAFDYVCRYFAPAYGIDEDPGTGSIQTMLGPYWCERLGRKEVRAWQASARGATMLVRPRGPRVEIVGKAVTVLEGRLRVPLHASPDAPSASVAV